MNRSSRTFAIFALLLGSTALVHAQSPSKAQLAVEKRFGKIDDIVISLDSASMPRPGRCGGSCFPQIRYTPPGGKGQASVVFVLVVDSTGSVEKGSVSFITAGPTPDFRDGVCTFANRVRYSFPAGTTPRRTLLLDVITLTSDQRLVPFSIEQTRTELRELPRDELFQQLSTLGHCR